MMKFYVVVDATTRLPVRPTHQRFGRDEKKPPRLYATPVRALEAISSKSDPVAVLEVDLSKCKEVR